MCQRMVLGHESDGRDALFHNDCFQLGVCSTFLIHFTQGMKTVDDRQTVLILIDTFEVLANTGFAIGIVRFRVILLFEIYQALKDLS